MSDIIIYSLVGLILLKTFGVDLTTIAVFGGAIGVGIGFGLQKIASNFISGIILIFEKSIEVGDIIEVDSNGMVFGTVKRFSGRYALIESFDGKEILVPNEDFIVGKVTNWTYSNNRARIEINVGVAYGTDLRNAKDIILKCANNYERCLRYPEAECFVTDFGDSDIKFLLFFWVADVSQGRFSPKSEVIMSIWDEFQKAGIKIPFPQREITVVNDYKALLKEPANSKLS
jgi:small-conductance mechanosensitive channel